MQRNLVVIAERDRNPALRVFRRRLSQRIIGNNQNRPKRGQLNGRAQSGDSGSDYQVIVFEGFRKAGRGDNPMLQRGCA
jgi:hypothetical protein